MRKENKLLKFQKEYETRVKKDADGETEGEVGIGSANHPPATDTNTLEFNAENLLEAQTGCDTPWIIPAKSDAISNDNALLYLLQGLPKLQALLPLVQQQVFDKGEKALIWCNSPVQQFFLLAALQRCWIDARVYHSELDAFAHRLY